MHFARTTTLLLAAAALSGCAHSSPASDRPLAGAPPSNLAAGAAAAGTPNLLGHALAARAERAAALAGKKARTPRIEDNMFLSAALARTQSQLQLAQMAETKAVVPALAGYVRRVAQERETLNQQLSALARRNGAASDSDHTPDAQRFAPLTGDPFERAYLAAQLEDQQNNIDFFQYEAANSRDPELRRLASGEVPRLQQDLADAQTIVIGLPVVPPPTQDEFRP